MICRCKNIERVWKLDKFTWNDEGVLFKQCFPPAGQTDADGGQPIVEIWLCHHPLVSLFISLKSSSPFGQRTISLKSTVFSIASLISDNFSHIWNQSQYHYHHFYPHDVLQPQDNGAFDAPNVMRPQKNHLDSHQVITRRQEDKFKQVNTIGCLTLEIMPIDPHPISEWWQRLAFNHYWLRQEI